MSSTPLLSMACCGAVVPSLCGELLIPIPPEYRLSCAASQLPTVSSVGDVVPDATVEVEYAVSVIMAPDRLPVFVLQPPTSPQ
jgi:hypothetical protein